MLATLVATLLLLSHRSPPASDPTVGPAAASGAAAPIPHPEPKTAAPAPAPDPGGPRNLLESADGSLRVVVGSYTDCSGASAVPRDAAELDPCFAGRYYFLGHNPGVFSPLLKMGQGAVLTYYDANGHAQRFRIVGWRVIARNAGDLTLAAGVAAQFQTCEVLDGAYVRILDAVRDSA